MLSPRRRGGGLAALALALPLAAGTGLPAHAALPASAVASAASGLPSVVPEPVSETAVSGNGFPLSAQTLIDVVSTDPDAKTVGIYLAALLAPATGYALPVVTSSQAQSQAVVLDPNGSADLGPEGYTLVSGGTGVTVTAHGAQGLFRGVQTLRQLLPAAVEASTPQPGPWTVAPVRISDSPRYAYRGVLLDVARRFFPVSQVKRYIDEAAAYKVNTLHLHLTDDQGWRIAIGAIPSLTTTGASTQNGFTGGSSWYYTTAQYQDIVAYAKSRYVTVVPEIDGPGHDNAALASVAGLNCDDVAKAPYSGFDYGFSLYCLSDSRHTANVTSFLNTVISAVAALTPGPYIHIGGDEAPRTTAAEYNTYASVVASAVTAKGKTVMGWHELGQATIPSGTLIQFWGDAFDRASVGTANESQSIRFVRNAVAQGARFVMSPADHAYLDMKYDTATPYGQSWAGYIPLRTAYDWDPGTATAKPDGTAAVVTEDRVAGVEAALWADYAYAGSPSPPTSTSQFPEPQTYADYMSFPRLPAIAEIGWSPRSTHDWNDFQQRLAAQGPRWTAAGTAYNPAPDVPWPASLVNLNGTHTLTTGGQGLDDPGSSTNTGVHLITWSLHGGSNQQWTFTQQGNGSYTLRNSTSGLCADVDSGSTSAGAAIIQWTCNGGSNQQWRAIPLPDGSYSLRSVKSGLLLTTASTADGATVTQQLDTNSALQHWKLG